MMSQDNSCYLEQYVPEKCSTPQMVTQYSDDGPNQQPHHSASSPNMSNSDVTYQVTLDQSHSVKVSRLDSKLPVRQITPDGDSYEKISKLRETRSEPALHSWDYGIIGHDDDKVIQSRWKRILEESFHVLTFNEFPLIGVTRVEKQLQFLKNCACVLWIATEKSKAACGYLKYFKGAALHKKLTEDDRRLLICVPLEYLHQPEVVIPAEYAMYDFIKEDENLITILRSHLKRIMCIGHDPSSLCSAGPIQDDFDRLKVQDEAPTQRAFNDAEPMVSNSQNAPHGEMVSVYQQWPSIFGGITVEDGPGVKPTACPGFDEKENVESPARDFKREDNRHIMISYKHKDSLDLATKINEALIEAGYRTWIDLEEMRGDMLDKMPEAVKNAFVVLVFLSPGYYESRYCEDEAKYAHKNDIPIIPIKNSNYKPEGWLDFITSSLVYYNFENEVFQEVFEKLLKDIEEKKEQPKQ
ncbi:unnamed protein product [Clavelina lepadiformis]|uniref:TIR domain-containing protein n=1 Tax=Clavelina lepadiformis TaxID=159417 RepID=A0ABP0GT87_CLALP